MSLPSEIASALSTRVQPVRTPAGYRLAAAGVAVGMVLLPLIYVALVIGLAWGVWWYATHMTPLLGRGGFATVVAYGGPIVIGTLVVAALVKPLFAPRRKKGEPVSLSPEAEPAVFAFVSRLADAVGAPRPRRVDVDCRANASASFRRGVLSMAGNDMVLTVGLPLADALTVRQLAGVIAHEFGHFAQGGGMRMTYLVESISGWFARVVYERDVFDEKLERAANSTAGLVGLVLGLAMYGVMLGRWVLRGLMNVGRWLSRGLLRQMEFDADRYEVRVAGVEAFRQTSDRLALLNVAEQNAYADLDIRIRERRVPDDLPALIAATESEIPETATAAFLAEVHAAKTGPLDTHPAVAERVASAEREGGDGLPFPDAPARSLFSDFGALARRATQALYDTALADVPVTVVRIEETLADRAAEVAAFTALTRLASGVGDLPPLSPAILTGPAPEAPAEALAAARDLQTALAPEAREISDRLGDADRGARLAEQGGALARAAVRFPARDYELERPSAEAATARLDACVAEREAARDALAPFHDAMRARLRTALAVAATLPERPLALDRAPVLLDVLGRIQALREDIRALGIGAARATVLVNAALAREAAGQADEYLTTRTLDEIADLRKRLGALRHSLADVPYPFQHGDGEVPLSAYVVETVPGREAIGDILHGAHDAAARVQEVRIRIWGEVAALVESAEAAHGLDPLPAPEPPAPEAEAEAA